MRAIASPHAPPRPEPPSAVRSRPNAPERTTFPPAPVTAARVRLRRPPEPGPSPPPTRLSRPTPTATVAPAAGGSFPELTCPADFAAVAAPGGRFSVVGFGSLLSERSARSTFPELEGFRVAALRGFRRVFAHAAPIFFERGIAIEATKEFSSLSVEPCDSELIVVTVFEIKEEEVPAFIEREHEFRFLAVVPEGLDGVPFTNRAQYDLIDSNCFFSVLAAKNLGEPAYSFFLDHTYLGDRKTTIREYLATTGAGIMEEEPPESLKSRYGG
ncbi:unnamed protein product [Miscanthus lutarioriparius]|uniref:Uncharacterized protein n=1 Tax=Miscanthus lutarioriparius TaxID=422564 RepID=A0A811RVV9_9POAL|nr:unnamed protein product [Miscanthus lutarioriparius]